MTTSSRGDVVLVRYPNSDLRTYKKRPVLVVQADDVDTGVNQRIVAMITTNVRRTGSTRVPINRRSLEGQAMGLVGDSVIAADNLAAIHEREIDKVIGRCPSMTLVDAALKVTLALD